MKTLDGRNGAVAKVRRDRVREYKTRSRSVLECLDLKKTDSMSHAFLCRVMDVFCAIGAQGVRAWSAFEECPQEEPLRDGNRNADALGRAFERVVSRDDLCRKVVLTTFFVAMMMWPLALGFVLFGAPLGPLMQILGLFCALAITTLLLMRVRNAFLKDCSAYSIYTILKEDCVREALGHVLRRCAGSPSDEARTSRSLRGEFSRAGGPLPRAPRRVPGTSEAHTPHWAASLSSSSSSSPSSSPLRSRLPPFSRGLPTLPPRAVNANAASARVPLARRENASVRFDHSLSSPSSPETLPAVLPQAPPRPVLLPSRGSIVARAVPRRALALPLRVPRVVPSVARARSYSPTEVSESSIRSRSRSRSPLPQPSPRDQAAEIAAELALSAEHMLPERTLALRRCDRFDAITYQPLAPSSVAFILDDSEMAPIALVTLKKLYARPHGTSATSSDDEEEQESRNGRNPFTNLPLGRISCVQIVKAESSDSDSDEEDIGENAD